MIKETNRLETQLGYRFKNKAFLDEALTHSSVGETYNNERLEYLGDAVLELTISEYLFHLGQMNEGKMTRLRASIVCSESLSRAANAIHLGDYLAMGKGEDVTGGRKRRSNLENAFEAVIGAVFLDSDFPTAKAVTLNLLRGNIALALDGKLVNDYKTKLQEQIQQHGESVIEYVLESASGPEHDKTFRVSLWINHRRETEGEGKTKKEAEQHAARAYLIEKV